MVWAACPDSVWVEVCPEEEWESAAWDPLLARMRELLAWVQAVVTTPLPHPAVLVSGLLRWRSLWGCSTAVAVADVGDTKAVAAECAEEEDVVARRYVSTFPLLNGRSAHEKEER